jgi:hypothetical protein
LTSMRRALLVLVALAGSSGGCDVCGRISQEVVVASDDPELGGLIANCAKALPPSASDSCWPEWSASDVAPSSCLPLCERAYAIVNPDPHRSGLIDCAFGMCKGQAHIELNFRSTCQ